MKKFLKFLVALILLVFIIVLLGPRPEKPTFDLSVELSEMSSSETASKILEREANTPGIRPLNSSQIYWANDSTKTKTDYVVVYLHGFSASPDEGFPTHIDFAKRYGYNLYAPRLDEHGLEGEDPLLNFTAKGYVNSAKEALIEAKNLGKETIVMSCSTGGTAALFLAANTDLIHSLILYSPNIDLYDSKSFLLTMPWGLKLARLVKGGKFHTWETTEEATKRWYTKYRLESLVNLKMMLDETMNKETFEKIKQPAFVAYYYKDENNQDEVVSVPRMKEMFSQLGTPETEKQMTAFPDAGGHGIQTSFMSEDYKTVQQATFQFAEKTLGLSPIK